MQLQKARWPLNLGWPRKISPHVYLLGNYHFNVYLVQGDECALVEAGMGCSADSVIQQVEQLGIPKEKVKYILAMHAHPDHSTGIPFLLAAFPHARVAASAAAQKMLSRDKAVRAFFKEDEEMSSILLQRGEIEKMPSLPSVMEMPVHLTVGEGDSIELGKGVKLEIYYTPGHSQCSLSAYLPSERVLFISDAAGFLSAPNLIFPIFFSGYGLYLDSLRRLRGMPADVLALPHENCFVTGQEISAFWDFAESETVKMYQQIKRWLEEGRLMEEMVEDIFAEHYKESLCIYTPRNIRGCAENLIKRVQEEAAGA